MSLLILVLLVDTPVTNQDFKLHVYAVFEDEAVNPVQKKSLVMNPTALEP